MSTMPSVSLTGWGIFLSTVIRRLMKLFRRRARNLVVVWKPPWTPVRWPSHIVCVWCCMRTLFVSILSMVLSQDSSWKWLLSVCSWWSCGLFFGSASVWAYCCSVLGFVSRSAWVWYGLRIVSWLFWGIYGFVIGLTMGLQLVRS